MLEANNRQLYSSDRSYLIQTIITPLSALTSQQVLRGGRVVVIVVDDDDVLTSQQVLCGMRVVIVVDDDVAGGIS